MSNPSAFKLSSQDAAKKKYIELVAELAGEKFCDFIGNDNKQN